MKRFAALLLCACIALSMAGCGSTASQTAASEEESFTASGTGHASETASESETSSEAAGYEIPDGFTDGYVFGNYEKYSDADTAKSLKGDEIWVKGAVTKIMYEKDSSSGKYVSEFLIQTEDGDTWGAFVGTSDSGQDTIEYELDFVKYGICARGVFVGVNDSGLPLIVIRHIFNYVDGTEKDSAAFADYVYTPSEESSETEEASVAESSAEESSAEESAGGVTPEFKQAMDTYEAYFDDYIAYMNAIAENPSDLNLLMQSVSILANYEKASEAIEDIDEDELSDADLAYYLEVSMRITQKLSNAALTMAD